MCECGNNDLLKEAEKKRLEFEANARQGIFPEDYNVMDLFKVFDKKLGL